MQEFRARPAPKASLVGWWDVSVLTDATHVKDQSGSGNDLTIVGGPTIANGVMTFTGTHYLISGSLPAVTLAGPWSVMLLALFSGRDPGIWMGLGNPSVANQYIALNAGTLNEGAVNCDYSWGPDGISFPAASYIALHFTSPGASRTISCTQMDNGAYCHLGNLNPTGTPQFAIGAVSRVGIGNNIINSMSVISAALWNRALGAGEAWQAYRLLQQRAGTHGIAVL